MTARRLASRTVVGWALILGMVAYALACGVRSWGRGVSE